MDASIGGAGAVLGWWVYRGGDGVVRAMRTEWW